MANVRKYPFKEMAPGDAFDIPYSAAALTSIRPYAHKHNDEHRVFKVRCIKDENVIEVGCYSRDEADPSLTPMLKPIRPAAPDTSTMRHKLAEVNAMMEERDRERHELARQRPEPL